jgi:RNA polymerase sigma-70 factor (ECF subfamily)
MAEIDVLVRRARDGDHQALETLVARFDRYVFGVALLVLGDRVEAQDAAQEALIKAARGLKGYDGRAAFRTWLYRITVNTCRDALRRRARRREAALDDVSLHASTDLLQAEVARERQQAVWQAVQSLDMPLREVVILRYYVGLSCVEIGEITGSPVNTVYWRLHRARRLLEPLLLAEDVLTDEIAARKQKGA